MVLSSVGRQNIRNTHPWFLLIRDQTLTKFLVPVEDIFKNSTLILRQCTPGVPDVSLYRHEIQLLALWRMTR